MTMSEQQKPQVSGTIIRGADGQLYFIPDAVMAPYRIEDQGLERAGALLDAGEPSATLAARHVALPADTLGRLNQLTDDISYGRLHSPADQSPGRLHEAPDVADPSLGRLNEAPDVIDPSLGRLNEAPEGAVRPEQPDRPPRKPAPPRKVE
jgi:hypothetical protein